MTLLKRISKALESLAYADAGELLPFEEKCRILGVDPPDDYRRYVPCYEVRPPKIAVNLGPELSLGVVDYAIATARDITADLALLRYPSGAAPAVVEPLLSRVRDSGLQYQIEDLKGPWVDAVAQFLRQHREVSFLVLGSADIHHETASDRGRKPHFPVPLVVVGEKTPLPQGY